MECAGSAFRLLNDVVHSSGGDVFFSTKEEEEEGEVQKRVFVFSTEE